MITQKAFLWTPPQLPLGPFCPILVPAPLAFQKSPSPFQLSSASPPSQVPRAGYFRNLLATVLAMINFLPKKIFLSLYHPLFASSNPVAFFFLECLRYLQNTKEPRSWTRPQPVVSDDNWTSLQVSRFFLILFCGPFLLALLQLFKNNFDSSKLPSTTASLPLSSSLIGWLMPTQPEHSQRLPFPPQYLRNMIPFSSFPFILWDTCLSFWSSSLPWALPP